MALCEFCNVCCFSSTQTHTFLTTCLKINHRIFKVRVNNHHLDGSLHQVVLFSSLSGVLFLIEGHHAISLTFCSASFHHASTVALASHVMDSDSPMGLGYLLFSLPDC